MDQEKSKVGMIALIVIVTVIVIGGGIYYLQAGTNNMLSTDNKELTAPFSIQELGITFDIPVQYKDDLAYQEIENGVIALFSKSVMKKESVCDAGSVGRIWKSKTLYNDFDSETRAPGRGDVKLGDEYVTFHGPQDTCTGDKELQEAISERIEALYRAVSTVRSTGTSVASNIFTYATIKEGQQYGAMIVEKVGSSNKNPSTKDNFIVEFVGTVTIVGTLGAPTGDPEDIGMGPVYSLNDITIDSLEKLPLLEGSKNDIKRGLWVGIKNKEIMENKDLKNGDTVELTIAKYHFVHIAADAWNSVDVVSVKKVL